MSDDYHSSSGVLGNKLGDKQASSGHTEPHYPDCEPDGPRLSSTEPHQPDVSR